MISFVGQSPGIFNWGSLTVRRPYYYKRGPEPKHVRKNAGWLAGNDVTDNLEHELIDIRGSFFEKVQSFDGRGNKLFVPTNSY